jgi:hypothetical protein
VEHHLRFQIRNQDLINLQLYLLFGGLILAINDFAKRNDLQGLNNCIIIVIYLGDSLRQRGLLPSFYY